jgi:hypothetical protein
MLKSTIVSLIFLTLHYDCYSIYLRVPILGNYIFNFEKMMLNFTN